MAKLLGKILSANLNKSMNINGLFLTFFLFSTLCTAFGHEEVDHRWISVKGRGVVESAPDLAILHLGVVSVAKTAQLASDSNNRSMENILESLESEGIEDEDIETTNFNLTPKREYRKNLPPLIVGFQVSNTLMVKIHDLEKVGDVLQKAIEAGGNNFHSLEFSISDPSEQEEKARRRAVEDAVSRAEELTEPLDADVGQPITIQEIQYSHHPQPHRRMMMTDAHHAESSSVPLHAPKDLITTVEVQIKFALE
jgi:uncharacterized protein YggE